MSSLQEELFDEQPRKPSQEDILHALLHHGAATFLLDRMSDVTQESLKLLGKTCEAIACFPDKKISEKVQQVFVKHAKENSTFKTNLETLSSQAESTVAKKEKIEFSKLFAISIAGGIAKDVLEKINTPQYSQGFFEKK